MKFLSINCPQSGLKHSVGHFQGIAMNFYFFFFGQTLLANEISIHKLCPQPGLKHSVGHFQGIAINFYFFLVKLCWKMKFLSINYVHNQV